MPKKTAAQWISSLNNEYPAEDMYLASVTRLLEIIYSRCVNTQDDLLKFNLMKVEKIVDVFRLLPNRPRKVESNDDNVLHQTLDIGMTSAVSLFYGNIFNKKIKSIEIVLFTLIEYDLSDRDIFRLENGDTLSAEQCLRIIQIDFHIHQYETQINIGNYFRKIKIDASKKQQIMCALFPGNVVINTLAVQGVFENKKNVTSVDTHSQILKVDNNYKVEIESFDPWVTILLKKHNKDNNKISYIQKNKITLQLFFYTWTNLHDFLDKIDLSQIEIMLNYFKGPLMIEAEDRRKYNFDIVKQLDNKEQEYYRNQISDKVTPIESLLYLLSKCNITIAMIPIKENPYSVQTCCKILKAGYLLNALESNDVTKDEKLLHKSFLEYLSHPERLKALRKINHQTLTAAFKIIAENPEKPESELLELISNIVPEPEPSIYDQVLDWFGSNSTETSKNSQTIAQSKADEVESSPSNTTTLTNIKDTSSMPKKTAAQWVSSLKNRYATEQTYLAANTCFLEIIYSRCVNMHDDLFRLDFIKVKKLVVVFRLLPNSPRNVASNEDQVLHQRLDSGITSTHSDFYQNIFNKKIKSIEMVLFTLVEYDLSDRNIFRLENGGAFSAEQCLRIIEIHYQIHQYENQINAEKYFLKVKIDASKKQQIMCALFPGNVVIDALVVQKTFESKKNVPPDEKHRRLLEVEINEKIEIGSFDQWVAVLLKKYNKDNNKISYIEGNKISLKVFFYTYTNLHDFLNKLDLSQIEIMIDYLQGPLIIETVNERQHNFDIIMHLGNKTQEYYRKQISSKITPIEILLSVLGKCNIPVTMMPINESRYSVKTCSQILEAGYLLNVLENNDVTKDEKLLHKSFLEYLSHPERLKALRKINHQTLTAALEIIAENPEKPESELLELISNIVPEPEPSIFDQMLDWFNTSTPTSNNNEPAIQPKVVEDKSSTPATTTMTVTAEQAKALEALSTLETQLFAHVPKIEQQLSHYSLLQRHKGAIESDEALKKHFDKTKSHLQQHFLAMMTLNSGEVQLSTDMVDIAIQISAYVSGKSIPVVGAVVNAMEQVATSAHARERYHYVHHVQQLVPTLDKIELYSECLAIECTYHKRQQIKSVDSMQDDAVLQKMNQFFKDLFSGANERKYFLYLLRTGHDASLLEKQAILDAYQIIGIMMSGEVKPGKRDEEILSQILKMALGDTYQNTALVTLINSVAAPIHMGQIVTTTANSISRDEFDAIKKEVQTLQQQKANNSQSFNAEYVVENDGSLSVVASAQVLVTTPMGKMTVPDAIAWLMKAQIGNDSYIQFSSTILSTYAEQQGIHVQALNVDLEQTQNREQLGLKKEGETSGMMQMHQNKK